MPLAGETIIAGKIPGERIATTIRTTVSGNVTTTETLIDSVVAPVVQGRIYRLRWTAALLTSVANDSAFVRLREDSLVGAQLLIARIAIPFTGGAGSRHPANIEVEYTADATENKTLVGTLIRVTGTGTITVQASTDFPVYLYVDFIR